jgi:hypothetical protein
VSASTPPDFISLEAHRDHDHPVERWSRWALVTALVALAAAGLVGVFGQRPTTTEAEGADATLRVKAPSALRGGLVFQGRFQVVARRPIRAPTLVLSAGWFENMSFNTIEPEPTRTTNLGDGVALEFPSLPAGRTLTVYVPFQVNPTTVGRRSQDVALRDGGRAIAVVERTLTIYP